VRVRPALFGIVVLLLAVPPALQAQMPAPTHFESWRPPTSALLPDRPAPDSGHAPPNGSGMLLGGVTGWAIGWAIGAAVGSAVGCSGSYSGECGFGPAISGALVGGSFAIPLGVHLGNHGRGELLKGVLVSAAIGGLGIAVGSSIDDTGLWLLLVPIGQIIGSTWMEAQSTPKVAPANASQ
jgi:hypothetical protein